MGRFSCVLFVALCVGAVAVNADPWFPDPFMTDSPPPPLYPAPETPSPYYDPPPYESPPSNPSPSDGSPSEEPTPSPWLSCGIWSVKTDTWPAPYTADMMIGDAFGSTDAVQVYGQVSMLDGLMSKGDDGYSDLLKQGITALLNAVDAHFKYTEDEIKKCFSFKTALISEDAASTQAQEFEAANEAYSSTP